MKQLVEATPGGWAGVAMKYGPTWCLVFVFTWFILAKADGNLVAIAGDAKAIRAEHMQMGTYLKGICLGVNRDPNEHWRCMVGGER